MDTVKVRRYQDKLLRRRAEILATMKRLEDENHDIVGQRHFDWLDRAWDENETRLLDRLTDSYLREIGRIEMALGRMLAGTYGMCLGCHQPIERGRLETFPETEFCLGCQDLRERFERVEKGGSYG